uniref:Prod1 n=1 Tax=Batrachuperus londongensis TaxID=156987 RepID=A0A0F6QEW0_BATLO|nr:Prod1 [Batrachuperus londongensis]
MKLLLLSVMLVAVLHSAAALQCYTRDGNGLTTVTTCREDQTQCLYIKLPSSMVQECKTGKQCQEVAEEATAIGYQAKCCSENLCNKS